MAAYFEVFKQKHLLSSLKLVIALCGRDKIFYFFHHTNENGLYFIWGYSQPIPPCAWPSPPKLSVNMSRFFDVTGSLRKSSFCHYYTPLMRIENAELRIQELELPLPYGRGSVAKLPIFSVQILIYSEWYCKNR